MVCAPIAGKTNGRAGGNTVATKFAAMLGAWAIMFRPSHWPNSPFFQASSMDCLPASGIKLLALTASRSANSYVGARTPSSPARPVTLAAKSTMAGMAFAIPETVLAPPDRNVLSIGFVFARASAARSRFAARSRSAMASILVSALLTPRRAASSSSARLTRSSSVGARSR